MKTLLSQRLTSRRFLIVAIAVVLIAGLAFGIQQAWARGQARPAEQISPLHPRFALLDADERVAEFYALGEHVIFVLDDQAYEVVQP